MVGFLFLALQSLFPIRILLASLYKDLCYVIFIRIIHSNKNFSFLLLLIGFPEFNNLHM